MRLIPAWYHEMAAHAMETENIALRAHLALLQAQQVPTTGPPWPAPQAKVPPVKAPPFPAPPPHLDRSNQAPGSMTAGSTLTVTTPVWDTALVEMCAISPEQQPPNLYDHLMETAKNSILILAMSHRLSETQRQELRDIVSILRSIVFH